MDRKYPKLCSGSRILKNLKVARFYSSVKNEPKQNTSSKVANKILIAPILHQSISDRNE